MEADKANFPLERLGNDLLAFGTARQANLREVELCKLLETESHSLKIGMQLV